MPEHEIVVWVLASVNDGKRKSERVGDVTAGMHEPFLSRVHFENALALIAGENCFDGEAFLPGRPVRLDESTLADNVSALEEVTVGVSCKGGHFYLGSALHVRRDENSHLKHFQILDPH